MGNLASLSDESSHRDDGGRKSRAERWALVKRYISLLEVPFPAVSLESVFVLPRETLLEHGHLPTFKEVKMSLLPMTTIAEKNLSGGGAGGGKCVYLASLVSGNNVERRGGFGPDGAGGIGGIGGHYGMSTSVDIAAAKAAEAAASASGGAVAVAVAAAAVGAAQAVASAAIAARASAVGEAADLYATAKAFLLEYPEFQYVWVASACMPPHMRQEKSAGAVPGVNGSNMFDHLHPSALLACDTMLVVPPERENLVWLPEQRERYSDLEIFSMSPWKALEGTISSLIGTVTYYAFRLGETLLFIGPYGPAPPSSEPSPLGRAHVRRLSSASPGSRGDGDSGRRDVGLRGVGSDSGKSESPGGRSSETPVSRAKAVATGAAKVLLAGGWGGTKMLQGSGFAGSVNKDHERGALGEEVGGDYGRGGGDCYGSRTTTAPPSELSAGGRRWGDSGSEGARIERAVSDALDRFGVNGSGTSPERNWRGVIRPCLLLRKAREDVEKFSDARGALKQAMCTMSVTREQAEEFFGVWRHLGIMGQVSARDRLATLNLLLFSLAVADGYYNPRRSPEYVSQAVEESLVTPDHLDLWMKDMSPDDSREILKSINLSGKKLAKLTIGSSHTGGAGVGTFLRGHATLKELEVEWEGVRDLTFIAGALADHKSLVRLNLTHNEIGPQGAAQLANALRRNRSLTELDLRENSIGPRGTKAIADALADNETMRTLYLQDNGIGDDGVIAMTEALMRNGRLRTVCLDGNQVTDVGAKVICIAIKMNLALKTLGLSRNALPDDSKRALHDAWSQREAESGLAQSGMFLDQPTVGAISSRGRWVNGIPLGNGLMNLEEDLEEGVGVLVSPTREEREPHGGGTNASGPGERTGGGSGGLLPRFSPVNDTFVRRPLW